MCTDATQSVKLTGLSCSGVITESHRLLRLFDTVELSRAMCTGVTYL
jgi:hypothetical protein